MSEIIEDRYILEQSESKTIDKEDGIIKLDLDLRLNTNGLQNNLVKKIIDDNLSNIKN